MYSDFYKIPLPALRFEKTEVINIDKSETTLKRGKTTSKSTSVNLDGHDDGTGDTTAQANVPAAPGGGNGPTNFNLRVEQKKITEFFGAKSKDTISIADFI